MTFSNVWHNLPNNLQDKINVMVLDTFSTRPMTTLISMFVIMETDTIIKDIGSTSEFVVGFAISPPTYGNVTFVRIIHQLISRSPSPCTQFMSIYDSQILTCSNQAESKNWLLAFSFCDGPDINIHFLYFCTSADCVLFLFSFHCNVYITIMEGMLPFILGLTHNISQVNPASCLVLHFLLELEGTECMPLFLSHVLQGRSLHV